jgi:hypothetical protein
MCAVLQVVRGEREGGKCADEAVTRKEWRQRRGIRRRQQKRGQRRILQGGNRKGRVLQISSSHYPEALPGLPLLGGRRFLVLHLVWIVPEEIPGLRLVGGRRFIVSLLRSRGIRGP